MPSIITGAPSTLQRAAGQAAGIFNALREREDEQRAEAERLELAKRRLDQTDRTIDMRESQFEYGKQRDAVADQRYDTQVSQGQAYTDQLVKHASETYGLDPQELQGMDSDGVLGTINLLEHQQQLQKAGETTQGIQEMLMEQLGIGQQQPLAPGVQTEEGIAAQEQEQEVDPQIQQLFTMAQNAYTLKDHKLVQEAMGGLVVKAQQAQAEAQERMQAASRAAPRIEEMRQQGLDGELYGALKYGLDAYKRGFTEYGEFRDLLNRVEDAQIEARKQQREILGRGVNNSFSQPEAAWKTEQNRKNFGIVGGLSSLQGGGGAGGGDAGGGGGGQQNPSYRIVRRDLAQQMGDLFDQAESQVLEGGDPQEIAMGLLNDGKIDRMAAAKLAWALSQQSETPEEQ